LLPISLYAYDAMVLSRTFVLWEVTSLSQNTHQMPAGENRSAKLRR
jgi:hypothetical protein